MIARFLTSARSDSRPNLSWRLLLWVVLSLCLCSWSHTAHAKPKKSRVVATAPEEEILTPTAKPDQRLVSLSFKQLGAWSSVNLRGADVSRTLGFSVRNDEMVVAAKLKLFYDYSPALIPELSHLRILLNEKVVSVEPLPQGKNLGNFREINLDPRLMSDVNFLRFNLIAHYTRQCEDPFHSSLWLTLSDLGKLELTLAHKSQVNDLKYLPAPFFDKRDDNLLKLPFVFANPPNLGTAQAAGVLASWFAIQAGNRGAQFPVSIGALPDSNAVVFLQSGDKLAGVDAPAGPTVSVRNHPTSPFAKLLVITGNNDAEMQRVARAIALIGSTLTGPSVTVAQDTPVEPRKPYDAPAWVPLDRPVRFGELARPEELRVQGWYPEVVRLNFRVSPDVFTWRSEGVPMTLKYRYTRLPDHKNSSLNVSLNNDFIHALPLNTPFRDPNDANRLNQVGSDNLSKRSDYLPLPPYAVGGRDQLQLAFYFDVLKHGECQNMPPDNLQAAIDPESTLDFSKFPHYVAMPNLAFFTALGYPFTRMADLAETTVVLPDRPNADELSIYLTVMGRLGESTGYPALRHTNVTAAEVAKEPNRDILVIGSANSQALMTQWADRIPVVVVNGERRVREPDATWMPTYRWEEKDVQTPPMPRADLNLASFGELTLLMGFESPLQGQRSVVLIHADKSPGLQRIADVLTDAEKVGQIRGDLAVFTDKEVRHTKASNTYYVGSLALADKVRWFVSDHPGWLAGLAVLACVLLAAASYGPLSRLLKRRVKKAL